MITQSPTLAPHILVVDDDNRLRVLLRRYLTEQGFIVSTAVSAADARNKLEHLAYDLMVLDVMMPGESGFDFTKAMRGMGSTASNHLPILLLTARGEANDRIEGFEVGADDYLQKPFEPRELVLRINAILRRVPKPQAAPSCITFGEWSYNIQRDELRRGDEVMRLTDMEAGLMRVFAAQPGVTISRETLTERANTSANAAKTTPVSDRTIDVQITRLRRKIEPDSKNPRYLVTVRGEGYMLMPDAES